MKRKLQTKLAVWFFAAAVALLPAPIFGQTNEPTPIEIEATEPDSLTETNSESEANMAVEIDLKDADGNRFKIRREAMVLFGENAVLQTNEYADAVVVIGGSARILGKCGDCVVIGGSLEVEGEITGDTVVVMGTLHAGPTAVLKGDVVAVGGGMTIADGASVSRKPVEVNWEKLKLGWLRDWVVHCVLKLRPLSLQVGWVWSVAALFLLVHAFIAIFFPKPVQACLEQLTDRPTTAFLSGLLAKFVLPILTALLVMTGVGLLFLPFLFAAWVLGLLVGKVAILQHLGGKVGRSFGADRHPLLALLLGSVMVSALYLIPVLGLIAFGIISLWGFGAATLALCRGLRSESQPPAPPTNPMSTPYPPVPGPTDPSTPPGSFAGASTPASRPVSSSPGFEGASASFTMPEPPIAAPPVNPILPAALAYPRASFWERMGAGFLDVIIVCLLGALVGGPPQAFLVALGYFAGMWAWKGTTVGGVVLKLQVVRLDGGRVTFLVAVVRGIAAAFSAFVLFLGFFWIGWDREKQAWHDKMVGTVVVRLPHSTPLVMI